MAINWSIVPEQFHYLQNRVLAKYGAELLVCHLDESLGRHVHVVERMSEDELNELAVVYNQIHNREDNLAIVDWNQSAFSDGRITRVAAAKYEVARQLFGFLAALRQLGTMGVEPFCRSLILPERPPPPPDWTSLSPEIAFLQEAVERYPRAWNEAWIMDWLDSANESDLRDLEALSKIMQPKRRLIREWLSQQAGSREEMYVGGLILLFFHAGIEYREPE